MLLKHLWNTPETITYDEPLSNLASNFNLLRPYAQGMPGYMGFAKTRLGASNVATLEKVYEQEKYPVRPPLPTKPPNSSTQSTTQPPNSSTR